MMPIGMLVASQRSSDLKNVIELFHKHVMRVETVCYELKVSISYRDNVFLPTYRLANNEQSISMFTSSYTLFANEEG